MFFILKQLSMERKALVAPVPLSDAAQTSSVCYKTITADQRY